MTLAELARDYWVAREAEDKAIEAVNAAAHKRLTLLSQLEEAMKGKGNVVVDGRLYRLTLMGSLVVEDVEVVS